MHTLQLRQKHKIQNNVDYLKTTITGYEKKSRRKLFEKHNSLSLESSSQKNQHCARSNASPENNNKINNSFIKLTLKIH
jgi:hypothetical protein